MKWGKRNELGVLTHPPAKIPDFLYKTGLVLIHSTFVREISAQLDKMGIAKYYYAAWMK
jgi:hypothetical protein